MMISMTLLMNYHYIYVKILSNVTVRINLDVLFIHKLCHILWTKSKCKRYKTTSYLNVNQKKLLIDYIIINIIKEHYILHTI